MALNQNSSLGRVVIVGGGVVSASCAYYLAARGIKDIVVLEEAISGPAAAASGRAGGFLSKSMGSGPLLDLMRRSFTCHEQLAWGTESLADKCDYRRLDVVSIDVNEEADGQAPREKNIDLPSWIDGFITKASVIGNKTNSAQVHPEKLTKTLFDLSAASILLGRKCNGIKVGGSGGRAVGVNLSDGETLSADSIILCLGPWTGTLTAQQWPLGLREERIPITGRRAHSVVLKPNANNASSPITSHAIFTELLLANKRGSVHPEIFPRPDGTVYVCGSNDNRALPESAQMVQIDDKEISHLLYYASCVSSHLTDAHLLTKQACYLPVNQDSALPIIGQAPALRNVWMAAGHGCWGILNAPATGELLANLMVDGGRDCQLDYTRFKLK